MLEILKRLLVDLSIEHVVHGIHLSFPVLLVHVALLLHSTHGIAVLLDVHLVRGALHSQTVDLLAELQDVALVLSEATLHSAHAQVQRAKAARGLRTAKFRLLLHSADLLKGLLLLLTNVVLQPRLRVRDVAFKVAAHHRDLVEAIAEGILGGVQALLRRSQILVREIDAAVQGVHGLVGVAGDLRLRLLEICLHSSDVVTDSG
mmetsp:Transcript_89009/g.197765  ORF Transcript_89009/g.197765 Transcript_89009/m.197765 type:complete len:204 (-) Transcript_89009:464-1075(-)